MGFFDLVISDEMLWTVIVGFIIAFVLAFGIGANDVANSFGTSVGARVLTLRQACILASIFETLGAILLGAKVSDTIRKGIIDVSPYKNDTDMLMLGNVAALSGSCVWLMAATLLRLPVSATHSIVGATVGFALVAHGSKGINWKKLGMIIGSWFASPVLAGAVSTGIFFICKIFILKKEETLEAGLKFLPIFYAITIVINLFSVFYDGPEMLHFHKIPLWGTFIIAFGSGIICAILVRFAIVPWLRKRIRADVYSPANTSSALATPMEYSPASSASGSVNNSTNNSRRNSLDLKKPSVTIIMEVEDGNLGDQKKPIEDCKNNIDSAMVTSTPQKPFIANGNLKTSVDKKENAPLMANEYKLGSATPGGATPESNVSGAATPVTGAAPTEEELNSANLAVAANGLKHVASVASTMTTSSTKPLLPSAGNDTPSDQSVDLEAEESNRSLINDSPEAARLFSFLQILTAVFGAFAHGGNDVSNAIGPLVSIWLTAKYGLVEAKTMTPPWILLYGGIGISLGLCILGRRVIKTMGDDLSKITPSSGFCIEIGSALTVLIASNVGIPISTTHCKVGAVVFVGRFRSRENVDWSLFRNIVLAWLVTLPVAGGISAAMMAGLRLTLQ